MKSPYSARFSNYRYVLIEELFEEEISDTSNLHVSVINIEAGLSIFLNKIPW